MKVSDISKITEFSVLNQELDSERTVEGCYISDLLSWVMGHAKPRNAWITIMSHINIIAIASLLDLGCIIIAEGEMPDNETIEKAVEENVLILSTNLSAFDAAKKLIEIGF